MSVQERKSHIPIRLTALENRYGGVEFSRMEDGHMAVSFARKAEFQEPVWKQNREQMNLVQAEKKELGGGTKMLKEEEGGAEAFILTPERSVGKELQHICSHIEHRAESMASLLLSAGEGNMAEAEQTQLKFDLSRAARRASGKGQELEQEEKKKKRFSSMVFGADSRETEAISEEEDMPEKGAELPEDHNEI